MVLPMAVRTRLDGGAALRRFFSAVIMSTTWRRRTTSASSSCACCVAERPWLRTNTLSEERQDSRVDSVGLREPAHRLREVPDLAWVHGDDGKSCRRPAQRPRAVRAPRSPRARPASATALADVSTSCCMPSAEFGTDQLSPSGRQRRRARPSKRRFLRNSSTGRRTSFAVGGRRDRAWLFLADAGSRPSHLFELIPKVGTTTHALPRSRGPKGQRSAVPFISLPPPAARASVAQLC